MNRSLPTLLWARVVATVLAFALLAGACGNDAGDSAAKEIKRIGSDVVPATLLDLTVTPEEAPPSVDEENNPFVEAIGLFGLREGDLLQGTLQISRFTEKANIKSSRFRNQVVQQIGSTEPRPFRMGGRTVYLTTGLRQTVAVWFNGRNLIVLSTRQDYDQPRTLLRAALEQVEL